MSKINKYQEALNRIKVHVPEYKLINNHIVEVDKHSDLCKLQELVDRETPMKPVKGTLCGKCNSFLAVNGIRFHRCLRLGCETLVDWSDKE